MSSTGNAFRSLNRCASKRRSKSARCSRIGCLRLVRPVYAISASWLASAARRANHPQSRKSVRSPDRRCRLLPGHCGADDRPKIRNGLVPGSYGAQTKRACLMREVVTNSSTAVMVVHSPSTAPPCPGGLHSLYHRLAPPNSNPKTAPIGRGIPPFE